KIPPRAAERPRKPAASARPYAAIAPRADCRTVRVSLRAAPHGAILHEIGAGDIVLRGSFRGQVRTASNGPERLLITPTPACRSSARRTMTCTRVMLDHGPIERDHFCG